MSTVTMEIPKEQAEQIEMLAARANLPAMDVVALAMPPPPRLPASKPGHQA